MPISADQLRRELQDATERLEKARTEREEAERKEKRIMAECAAYKTLLEDDGVHPVPNIIVASEDSDDNNAAPSKRSRIREALRLAGSGGVAPVDIFRSLQRYGVKRPYVHSTLYRMKESGEVAERNGKYILTAVH